MAGLSARPSRAKHGRLQQAERAREAAPAAGDDVAKIQGPVSATGNSCARGAGHVPHRDQTCLAARQRHPEQGSCSIRNGSPAPAVTLRGEEQRRRGSGLPNLGQHAQSRHTTTTLRLVDWAPGRLTTMPARCAHRRSVDIPWRSERPELRTDERFAWLDGFVRRSRRDIRVGGRDACQSRNSPWTSPPISHTIGIRGIV